jgi:hypothetical protein
MAFGLAREVVQLDDRFPEDATRVVSALDAESFEPICCLA